MLQDARFCVLSKKFIPLNNKNKPLLFNLLINILNKYIKYILNILNKYIKYIYIERVKHEQNVDCEDGYVKVFDCSLDQKDICM